MCKAFLADRADKGPFTSVGALVVDSALFPLEGSRAVPAGIGLCSSVLSLMNNQVSFGCEVCMAEIANKGPFASVSSLVISEAVRPSIPLGAEPAGVGQFTIVRRLVIKQLRFPGKPALTHVARKWLFASVYSQMIFENVFATEVFRAKLAVVHFSSVQSLMIIQIPFLRKAALAETAAKGLLAVLSHVSEHVVLVNKKFLANIADVGHPFPLPLFVHGPICALVMALLTGLAGMRLPSNPRLMATGKVPHVAKVWTAGAGGMTPSPVC